MDDYNVKDFIENHAELISEENFLQLYKEAGMGFRSFKRSLTEVFLTAGINPLEYMNKVPSYFLEGSTIAEFDIPRGVTKIEGYAFADCCDLTHVQIPAGVLVIGSSVFLNCSSLTSIAIPNSVMSIGESAFYNCSSLTSIMLPNSVTRIGESAFYGCSSLTSITISNNVTAVEEMTFRSCANLAKVVLPAGITKIGKEAFIVCPKLTGIDFKGTTAEWKNIEKGEHWREKPLKTVHCVDGDINL